LPDWELAFRFASGRLCLAFCATVGERWRRSFERLRSPADLGRWTVESGLLAKAPELSQADLEAARQLRESIYRSVRASMEERPPRADDVEIINSWAARPDLAPRLGPDWTKHMSPSANPIEPVLSAIARDTVDLLGGTERRRVRECAAPDCSLLFVDRSRPGRRRWCADGACGNRNRAVTYRRHHGPSRPRSRRDPGAPGR